MDDSTLPPIDGQILQLTKLAEATRQQGSLPPKAVENLNQLIRSLYLLNQRALQYKEEKANLLALIEVGQVVNSSLELDEVLRVVMDTIVRLTGAERGFLMLRNAQGELSIRIARNWEQESIGPSEFAISRTIVNRVVAEGQPVLTTNAQEDPRFDGQESVIAYNLRSILCVPLKVKEEITGVIYTDNRIRTGIFNEGERSLLSAFANQAAIAIENARLFQSVRSSLAEVSELKGLMDNVFASIASGVITADIDDQVTLLNRAAQAILGKPDSEVIGHPLLEVLPFLDSEILSKIQEVRQNDHPVVGLEIQPNLPGRGRLYWNLNLSALRDSERDTQQGIAIVLDDLTEKKRLEGQRRLFERMVSPAVINQLDPDTLQLGGKRAQVTALFADIRGFTRFSESIPPEQLVSILNRYLAAAADAVLAQEGTIDKFLGDAVMAWFNAPIPQPDHALRAIRAALQLRQAVQALQSQVPPEHQLSFGVGIHYGEVVLGLVGTDKRMEYTAIGDSVNTAKRIQENSAAGQILLSAAAYALVSDWVVVRPLDALYAKGKSQPIQIFEVIDLR